MERQEYNLLNLNVYCSRIQSEIGRLLENEIRKGEDLGFEAIQQRIKMVNSAMRIICTTKSL